MIGSLVSCICEGILIQYVIIAVEAKVTGDIIIFISSFTGTRCFVWPWILLQKMKMILIPCHIRRSQTAPSLPMPWSTRVTIPTYAVMLQQKSSFQRVGNRSQDYYFSRKSIFNEKAFEWCFHMPIFVFSHPFVGIRCRELFKKRHDITNNQITSPRNRTNESMHVAAYAKRFA